MNYVYYANEESETKRVTCPTSLSFSRTLHLPHTASAIFYNLPTTAEKTNLIYS